jgi:hypothetical protein
MASFNEIYLEPYHLHLMTALVEPFTINIGEFKEKDISIFKFEKIWSVNFEPDPGDASKYAKFVVNADNKTVSVVSSWLSEERPFDTLSITCKVLGIGRRPKNRKQDPLITAPFWLYLLNDSLFHIENEDYHVAILLTNIAAESFFYNFMEAELRRVKKWKPDKIKKYVENINVFPSIIDKIDILLSEVLQVKISPLIYGEWKKNVRGPRNHIIHTKKKDMYDLYKFNSAMIAIITTLKFIREILSCVPIDEYLELVKEGLSKKINHLMRSLKQHET